MFRKSFCYQEKLPEDSGELDFGSPDEKKTSEAKVRSVGVDKGPSSVAQPPAFDLGETDGVAFAAIDLAVRDQSPHEILESVEEISDSPLELLEVGFSSDSSDQNDFFDGKVGEATVTTSDDSPTLVLATAEDMKKSFAEHSQAATADAEQGNEEVGFSGASLQLLQVTEGHKSSSQESVPPPSYAPAYASLSPSSLVQLSDEKFVSEHTPPSVASTPVSTVSAASPFSGMSLPGSVTPPAPPSKPAPPPLPKFAGRPKVPPVPSNVAPKTSAAEKPLDKPPNKPVNKPVDKPQNKSVDKPLEVVASKRVIDEVPESPKFKDPAGFSPNGEKPRPMDLVQRLSQQSASGKDSFRRGLAIGVSLILIGGSGYYSYSNFFGETTESVSVVQGSLLVPPAKFQNTAKKAAQNSKNSLAARALPILVVSDTHRKYFSALNSSLIHGNPEAVVGQFKQKSPNPLDGEGDKKMAAELEARYYLLVGQPKKAFSKLQKMCPTITEENVTNCIHFIRAAIEIQDFTTAFSLLNNAKTLNFAGKNGIFEGEFSLMNAATNALGKPNLSSLKQFSAQLLAEQKIVSAEWARQRTIWFVRAALKQPKIDLVAFSRYLIVEKKAALEETLSSYSSRYKTEIDPLLVSFIKFLADKVEYEGEFPKIRISFPSELNLLATVFSVANDSYLNSADSLRNSAVLLQTQQPFKELNLILSAAAALDEDDVTSAQRLLEIPHDVKEYQYEWAILRGRYALLIKHKDLLQEAMVVLQRALRSEPKLQTDFSYWYLQAKLLSALHQDSEPALQQARKLAVTPKELGLIAVEDIQALRYAKKIPEALKAALLASQKIPNHGPLLRVTADVVAQSGGDPTILIDRYSQIPQQFLKRGQVFEPFSLLTLKKLTSSN